MAAVLVVLEGLVLLTSPAHHAHSAHRITSQITINHWLQENVISVVGAVLATVVSQAKNTMP